MTNPNMKPGSSEGKKSAAEIEGEELDKWIARLDAERFEREAKRVVDKKWHLDLMAKWQHVDAEVEANFRQMQQGLSEMLADIEEVEGNLMDERAASTPAQAEKRGNLNTPAM